MKFCDYETQKAVNIEGPELTDHIKLKWNEIHDTSNIFRYKVNNLKERRIGEYFLQLNTNRSTKRRIPEHITNICQPFDENKFNFTKVCNEEILFTFQEINGDKDDTHFFIINVSPNAQYHTLLCPYIYKRYPQVITKHSLRLVINLMLLAKDRDMKIAFNGLCALASVNHLHFHLFFEKNILPIETANCKHIKGSLYCLENYPVPAFCFEISENSKIIDEIYKLLEFFLKKSIAHNIFITRGNNVGPQNVEYSDMPIRVVIYPRKIGYQDQQVPAFNVAALELSGWLTIYNIEDFNNLQKEDIERELKKWKIENFDDLCEEVSLLY